MDIFFPILQMKKQMLSDFLSQLFCSRTSIHIKVFGKKSPYIPNEIAVQMFVETELKGKWKCLNDAK